MEDDTTSTNTKPVIIILSDDDHDDDADDVDYDAAPLPVDGPPLGDQIELHRHETLVMAETTTTTTDAATTTTATTTKRASKTTHQSHHHHHHYPPIPVEEETNKISLFMTIMNWSDPQRARDVLIRFRYNIEQAITALIDETLAISSSRQTQEDDMISGCANSKSGSGFILVNKRMTTRSVADCRGQPTAGVKRALFPAIASSSRTEHKSKSARSSSCTTTSSSRCRSNPSGKKTATEIPIRNPSPISYQPITGSGRSEATLSHEWHQCYQKILVAREEQVDQPIQYFVDDSFPPLRSSLDGRIATKMQKKDNNNHPNTATTTDNSPSTPQMVLCRCGIPAAAKVVQREGPNYGRFFLACGRTDRTTRILLQHQKEHFQNQEKQQQQKVSIVPKLTQSKLRGGKETTAEEQCAITKTTKATTSSSDCNYQSTVLMNPYRITRNSAPGGEPSTPPTSIQAPTNWKCNFFQWDPDGSKGARNTGYGTRYALLQWQHFGLENQCVLYKQQPSYEQVRQGAVGNCWFLSALAVVAEKEYLIRQILPHTSLNEAGCYQINLWLDGRWTPIIVDSNLPVIVEDDATYSLQPSKRRKRPNQQSPAKRAVKATERGGVPMVDMEVSSSPASRNVARRKSPLFRNAKKPITTLDGNGCLLRKTSSFIAYPAFCAVPHLQLWSALVEKAYAKAHGCYAQLSGGFIAEGLQDLTGAPTETVIFSTVHFKDSFWEVIRTFQREGFVMGVATASGGDGLVGGHAYSVLDVIQVDDSVVGAQSKLTDFFGDSGDDIARKLAGKDRTTLRLVRIRNPWGKREWKGDFSADSECWTNALRRKLGPNQTFAKGDGTFFMSFDDMLRSFHHMDVAKTRQGWFHSSIHGHFPSKKSSVDCFAQVYRITPAEPTLVFITLIQPKKRSNVQSKYWYCDPCLVVLKRSANHKQCSDWSREACVLSGIRRQNTVEIFLEPMYDYVCVPWSLVARSRGDDTFSFRLSCYSGSAVTIKEECHTELVCNKAVHIVHEELLSCTSKSVYPVAVKSFLACVPYNGSYAFIAVNGTDDHFILLKLTLHLVDGMVMALGQSESTWDVKPRSQRIIAVVANNMSESASFKVSYLASTIGAKKSGEIAHRAHFDQGCDVALSVAADCLAGAIIASEVRERGTITIAIDSSMALLGRANSAVTV